MPKGIRTKTVAPAPPPRKWNLYYVRLEHGDRSDEYYVQAPSAGAAMRAALPQWAQTYEVDASEVTIRRLGQVIIYDNQAAP